MGQKNGFHAFGYNSAESEPIWMKFETLSANWGKTKNKNRVAQSSSEVMIGNRLNIYAQVWYTSIEPLSQKGA